MQMFYARADWRNPKNYPAYRDPNATMWAWEFLRRNLNYAALFDHVKQAPYKNDTHREEEETRLAVAWNLSKLLDPKKSYQELAHEHDKPLDGFYFVGQRPEVVLPVFEPDEIYFQHVDDPSLRLNVPLVACSEQKVCLAPNDVMLRICLDGDVDLQIDRFKTWLNESREVHNAEGDTAVYKNKELRAYNVQGAKNDKSSLSPGSFYLPVQAKKINFSHLQPSLQILDAIAGELWMRAKDGTIDTMDDAALDDLQEMIRETLNEQMNEDINGKQLTKAQFRDYQAFGYWYSLSKKYVALAHRDLSAQINQHRSTSQKNK